MEMISKFSRTPVAVPRGRRLRLLAAAMPLAALLATACSPAQTSAASSGGPARQPPRPPPSPAADCNSVTTCYTVCWDYSAGIERQGLSPQAKAATPPAGCAWRPAVLVMRWIGPICRPSAGYHR